MPSRSVWKSALLFLGLLLIVIGMPWIAISSLRQFGAAEYQHLTWLTAATITQWGVLAWSFYVLFCFVAFFIAVTVFLNHFYSYFFYPTARIDVTGQTPRLITAFELKVNVPKWELADMGGHNFVIQSLYFAIPMSVNPITANPKVRKLTYEVQFSSAIDTPTAAHILQLVTQASKVSSKGRVDGDGSLKETLERWLKYHLYIFNERNSRHLGALFNPLDNEQQKAFWDLVNEYFIPIMAGSGLMVRRANFNLAE